MIKTVMTVS